MKLIQKHISIAVCIAVLFFGAVILNSCTKFDAVNTNTKVNNSSTPDALFASATKNLIDLHTSTNQNFNPFRLWAQHWTETTYTDEANYNIVQRSIPDRWFNILYVRVLENYETAKSIETATNPTGDEATRANRLAIIDIMEVYTYCTLVELFGDVPYTEANKIETTLLPKYDSQTTIYSDLIKRLYNDISTLNTNSDAPNFDASDLIYSGNTSAWQKFANSMLLRMGMMIVDAPLDAYTASKVVKDALAGGVFTSNSDNALFQYLGSNPNTNPLYVDLVQSGRQDYVACTTLIDTLMANEDMRYTAFFTTLGDGTYAGGVPGKATNVNVSSYPADIILNPTLPGVFFTYAETELLQAEAGARGIGGLTPADAQQHYENGIQASIDYWSNLSGISPETTSDLINTVYAYPTAHNEQMKAIAFQLWIALYNQGFEAWTQWRRLDYPTLTLAANPYSAAKTKDGIGIIPKRFTYPSTEPGTNTNNYADASKNIGGDYLYTQLFWDKYNNQWGTNNQYPALSGN